MNRNLMTAPGWGIKGYNNKASYRTVVMDLHLIIIIIDNYLNV